MRLPRRPNRGTLVSFAGLAGGIAGLVIQWLADPAKFARAEDSFGITFPPGIVFIVVLGVLMLVTARWWWHPVFAVLAALWIVGAGTLAGQLQPNLTSDNPGTVIGNVVMAASLVAAAVAGVVSMITTLRAAPRAETVRARSDGERQQ